MDSLRQGSLGEDQFVITLGQSERTGENELLGSNISSTQRPQRPLRGDTEEVNIWSSLG